MSTPQELTVTLTSAEIAVICESLHSRAEKLAEIESRVIVNAGPNHPARTGVQDRMRTCLNLIEALTIGLLQKELGIEGGI